MALAKPLPGTLLDARSRIAIRAAQEFKNGMIINLGIGIPTQAINYVPEDVEVEIQSENGLLGIGPYPAEGDEDFELINAGCETVSEVLGTSYFSSQDSFGMIRGKHVNLTMLGGMQVSAKGDIANWVIPGVKVTGMGGAMDLVANVPRVIVCMEHTTKDGQPKILEECTLPLTGSRCCSRIVTEIAVIDCTPEGLVLVEISPDTTLEHVIKVTGAPLRIPENGVGSIRL